MIYVGVLFRELKVWIEPATIFDELIREKWCKIMQQFFLITPFRFWVLDFFQGWFFSVI